MINNTVLIYFQLIIIFTEIANVINNRPLTNDFDDLEALISNHFLLRNWEEKDGNICKQWKYRKYKALETSGNNNKAVLEKIATEVIVNSAHMPRKSKPAMENMFDHAQRYTPWNVATDNEVPQGGDSIKNKSCAEMSVKVYHNR